MDFSYTLDQESLRELARQIFDDKATPRRLEEIEQSADRIDHELWAELSGAGLLGVCIPEAYGGSGLGITELGIILEEVGRAVAPVPAYATLVLGALPIAEFGSDDQKKSLLPGVVSGAIILSAALAEPNNNDPTSPVTTATPNDDGWHVTGTKLCVPAAAAAQVIVVPAHIGNDIALLLVDPRSERVELEPVETTNRDMQYLMTLDEVSVPRSALLGDVAQGRDMLRWLIQRATLGVCAMQSGVVDRALRMTAEYVSSREQFDRPLAAFQAVSQRAANAYVDAESVRLSTMAATWQLSEGLDADAAIATAKYFASEAAQRVVHAAQHLHGGVGVDLTYPLHRYFTWAKQLELTMGSATHQLLHLGETLASAPA
jgi:alkylation response protein AidB-like acyl-CoA dehydrogenase